MGEGICERRGKGNVWELVECGQKAKSAITFFLPSMRWRSSSAAPCCLVCTAKAQRSLAATWDIEVQNWSVQLTVSRLSHQMADVLQ